MSGGSASIMFAAAPIADNPPHQIERYRGPHQTVEKMIEMTLGPRGEQSILVRSLKDHIVRSLQPKAYLSEIIAVRNFATEYIRYSNDAVGVEQVQDPQRIVEQIVAHGRAVGDCDDIATWIAATCRQLGREVEFVIVGFGAPNSFSHVFTRVMEDKSGRWIVCDPVAGTDEGRMLRRVTTYQTYRVD